MLAVHDVNVTLPGRVMTPGTEGSKAASVVLSPALTSLRRHGSACVQPGYPTLDLSVGKRQREANSHPREMRRFYCHHDKNPAPCHEPLPGGLAAGPGVRALKCAAGSELFSLWTASHLPQSPPLAGRRGAYAPLDPPRAPDCERWLAVRTPEFSSRRQESDTPMTTDTTIVGINLTDLSDDGTTDPLSTVVLDLCTTSARLVQSPREYVGAVAALTALRDTVASGLPETAALVGHLLTLIEQADVTMKEAD